MTLPRVSRGDKLMTAALQNRIIDGAEIALRWESGQPLPGYSRPRTADMIRVINESGAGRAQGSVLEILDLEPTTITRQDLLFSAGLATGSDVPWCVVRDAVAADGSVAAHTSGTFLCLVDIISTVHTFAKVVSGETVADSGTEGQMEILWHPGTTGVHLCLVRYFGAAEPSTGGDPSRSVSIPLGSQTLNDAEASKSFTSAAGSYSAFGIGVDANGFIEFTDVGDFVVHVIMTASRGVITAQEQGYTRYQFERRTGASWAFATGAITYAQAPSVNTTARGVPTTAAIIRAFQIETSDISEGAGVRVIGDAQGLSGFDASGLLTITWHPR